MLQTSFPIADRLTVLTDLFSVVSSQYRLPQSLVATSDVQRPTQCEALMILCTSGPLPSNQPWASTGSDPSSGTKNILNTFHKDKEMYFCT